MQRSALGFTLLLALAAAPVSAGGPPAKAVNSSLGTIAGLVTDSHGVAQMGATVVLQAPDGRILQRLFTSDRGAFLVDRLAPGVYGLRVTLANFLPVLKENVLVEPGGRAFLSINLASLSDALASISGRGRPKPESDDDWKWVVRSSGATRPILRLLPLPSGAKPDFTATTWHKPDYRARVEFSGGGARFGNLGSEADFSTAFGYTQSLFGATLLLGGNLGYGYDRSTPATAFRGAIRRERADGTTPEISVALRQIYMPNAGSLQALSLGFEDSAKLGALLGDDLRLEYGVLYDSIDFLNHLTAISPFGRAILRVAPGSTLRLIYADGLPRPRPSGDDPLSDSATQLSAAPRISMRGGAPSFQKGRHLETTFVRQFTPSAAFQISAYRDDVTDLAVGASSGTTINSGDFLPDLFTQNYSYNSGSHHLMGARMAYQQKLGGNVQATLTYGYGGMLGPEHRGMQSDTLENVRDILHLQRRHALAVKLGSSLPGSKTNVLASYKWVSGPSILAGDLYDETFGRAEPNLNLVIRQPLPQLVPFTGRVEALADFRNLLAQGYIPITTADGRRIILLQNVRSFRGGFSFNF